MSRRAPRRLLCPLGWPRSYGPLLRTFLTRLMGRCTMRDGRMNVIIVKPKKQVRYPTQPHASTAGSRVVVAVGHVQPGHGHDCADKAAASETCVKDVLRVCCRRWACSCVLQSGFLPKSCLEAEAKEERATCLASLSSLVARHTAQQICIHEQDGETSSLLFNVDARSDVQVSPYPDHPIAFCVAIAFCRSIVVCLTERCSARS